MSVNTPYTVRASVLRNVYFGLEEEKSLDDRLDLLLQAKFILKEFDCELTRDTIRLIDEEADLLSKASVKFKTFEAEIVREALTKFYEENGIV